MMMMMMMKMRIVTNPCSHLQDGYSSPLMFLDDLHHSLAETSHLKKLKLPYEISSCFLALVTVISSNSQILLQMKFHCLSAYFAGARTPGSFWNRHLKTCSGSSSMVLS
ncbi:uncharacterized protein LOC125185481 [Salvia hispanica]|uniref:uncharacterized protein LOC125185481 n=1 Tax=Salvia hispanica TaxID=49212 RepID=UPI002009BAE4|nr:uncharacterized protein LOC125185481 [Salvia hispanica]